MPSDLSRYGEVLELAEPRVKLRVDREQISQVLSTVLANHTLEDVSVEDPPLEEVIAQVFAQSAEKPMTCKPYRERRTSSFKRRLWRMLDYFKQILTAQYEASLSMLNRMHPSMPERALGRQDCAKAPFAGSPTTHSSLPIFIFHRTNAAFELRDLHDTVATNASRSQPLVCRRTTATHIRAALPAKDLDSVARKQRNRWPARPVSRGTKSLAAKCTSSTSATSSTTLAN